MSHLDSHNVPRRRIKLDVSTRKHAFTRVRARVTAFSSARSSSRPFPRRRCVFAKYGRSGGVRVCLSRPAVSKANDLPWNLDNLSARLQPEPRSGGLHLFRGAPLVPSLSLFLALSFSPTLCFSFPPLSIRLVSNRRYQLHRGCPDPLLIVHRCTLPMPRV